MAVSPFNLNFNTYGMNNPLRVFGSRRHPNFNLPVAPMRGGWSGPTPTPTPPPVIPAFPSGDLGTLFDRPGMPPVTPGPRVGTRIPPSPTPTGIPPPPVIPAFPSGDLGTLFDRTRRRGAVPVATPQPLYASPEALGTPSPAIQNVQPNRITKTPTDVQTGSDWSRFGRGLTKLTTDVGKGVVGAGVWVGQRPGIWGPAVRDWAVEGMGPSSGSGNVPLEVSRLAQREAAARLTFESTGVSSLYMDILISKEKNVRAKKIAELGVTPEQFRREVQYEQYYSPQAQFGGTVGSTVGSLGLGFTAAPRLAIQAGLATTSRLGATALGRSTLGMGVARGTGWATSHVTTGAVTTLPTLPYDLAGAVAPLSAGGSGITVGEGAGIGVGVFADLGIAAIGRGIIRPGAGAFVQASGGVRRSVIDPNIRRISETELGSEVGIKAGETIRRMGFERKATEVGPGESPDLISDFRKEVIVPDISSAVGRRGRRAREISTVGFDPDETFSFIRPRGMATDKNMTWARLARTRLQRIGYYIPNLDTRAPEIVDQVAEDLATQLIKVRGAGSFNQFVSQAHYNALIQEAREVVLEQLPEANKVQRGKIFQQAVSAVQEETAIRRQSILAAERDAFAGEQNPQIAVGLRQAVQNVRRQHEEIERGDLFERLRWKQSEIYQHRVSREAQGFGLQVRKDTQVQQQAMEDALANLSKQSEAKKDAFLKGLKNVRLGISSVLTPTHEFTSDGVFTEHGKTAAGRPQSGYINPRGLKELKPGELPGAYENEFRAQINIQSLGRHNANAIISWLDNAGLYVEDIARPEQGTRAVLVVTSRKAREGMFSYMKSLGYAIPDNVKFSDLSPSDQTKMLELITKRSAYGRTADFQIQTEALPTMHNDRMDIAMEGLKMRLAVQERTNQFVSIKKEDDSIRYGNEITIGWEKWMDDYNSLTKNFAGEELVREQKALWEKHAPQQYKFGYSFSRLTSGREILTSDNSDAAAIMSVSSFITNVVGSMRIRAQREGNTEAIKEIDNLVKEVRSGAMRTVSMTHGFNEGINKVDIQLESDKHFSQTVEGLVQAGLLRDQGDLSEIDIIQTKASFKNIMLPGAGDWGLYKTDPAAFAAAPRYGPQAGDVRFLWKPHASPDELNTVKIMNATQQTMWLAGTIGRETLKNLIKPSYRLMSQEAHARMHRMWTKPVMSQTRLNALETRRQQELLFDAQSKVNQLVNRSAQQGVSISAEEQARMVQSIYDADLGKTLNNDFITARADDYSRASREEKFLRHAFEYGAYSASQFRFYSSALGAMVARGGRGRAPSSAIQATRGQLLYSGFHGGNPLTRDYIRAHYDEHGHFRGFVTHDEDVALISTIRGFEGHDKDDSALGVLLKNLNKTTQQMEYFMTMGRDPIGAAGGAVRRMTVEDALQFEKATKIKAEDVTDSVIREEITDAAGNVVTPEVRWNFEDVHAGQAHLYGYDYQDLSPVVANEISLALSLDDPAGSIRRIAEYHHKKVDLGVIDTYVRLLMRSGVNDSYTRGVISDAIDALVRGKGTGETVVDTLREKVREWVEFDPQNRTLDEYTKVQYPWIERDLNQYLTNKHSRAAGVVRWVDKNSDITNIRAEALAEARIQEGVRQVLYQGSVKALTKDIDTRLMDIVRKGVDLANAAHNQYTNSIRSGTINPEALDQVQSDILMKQLRHAEALGYSDLDFVAAMQQIAVYDVSRSRRKGFNIGISSEHLALIDIDIMERFFDEYGESIVPGLRIKGNKTFGTNLETRGVGKDWVVEYLERGTGGVKKSGYYIGFMDANKSFTPMNLIEDNHLGMIAAGAGPLRFQGKVNLTGQRRDVSDTFIFGLHHRADDYDYAANITKKMLNDPRLWQKNIGFDKEEFEIGLTDPVGISRASTTEITKSGMVRSVRGHLERALTPEEVRVHAMSKRRTLIFDVENIYNQLKSGREHSEITEFGAMFIDENGQEEYIHLALDEINRNSLQAIIGKATDIVAFNAGHDLSLVRKLYGVNFDGKVITDLRQAADAAGLFSSSMIRASTKNRYGIYNPLAAQDGSVSAAKAKVRRERERIQRGEWGDAFAGGALKGPGGLGEITDIDAIEELISRGDLELTAEGVAEALKRDPYNRALRQAAAYYVMSDVRETGYYYKMLRAMLPEQFGQFGRKNIAGRSWDDLGIEGVQSFWDHVEDVNDARVMPSTAGFEFSDDRGNVMQGADYGEWEELKRQANYSRGRARLRGLGRESISGGLPGVLTAAHRGMGYGGRALGWTMRNTLGAGARQVGRVSFGKFQAGRYLTGITRTGEFSHARGETRSDMFGEVPRAYLTQALMDTGIGEWARIMQLPGLVARSGMDLTSFGLGIGFSGIPFITSWWQAGRAFIGRQIGAPTDLARFADEKYAQILKLDIERALRTDRDFSSIAERIMDGSASLRKGRLRKLRDSGDFNIMLAELHKDKSVEGRKLYKAFVETMEDLKGLDEYNRKLLDDDPLGEGLIEYGNIATQGIRRWGRRQFFSDQSSLMNVPVVGDIMRRRNLYGMHLSHLSADSQEKHRLEFIRNLRFDATRLMEEARRRGLDRENQEIIANRILPWKRLDEFGFDDETLKSLQAADVASGGVGRLDPRIHYDFIARDEKLMAYLNKAWEDREEFMRNLPRDKRFGRMDWDWKGEGVGGKARAIYASTVGIEIPNPFRLWDKQTVEGVDKQQWHLRDGKWTGRLGSGIADPEEWRRSRNWRNWSFKRSRGRLSLLTSLSALAWSGVGMGWYGGKIGLEFGANPFDEWNWTDFFNPEMPREDDQMGLVRFPSISDETFLNRIPGLGVAPRPTIGEGFAQFKRQYARRRNERDHALYREGMLDEFNPLNTAFSHRQRSHWSTMPNTLHPSTASRFFGTHPRDWGTLVSTMRWPWQGQQETFRRRLDTRWGSLKQEDLARIFNMTVDGERRQLGIIAEPVGKDRIAWTESGLDVPSGVNWDHIRGGDFSDITDIALRTELSQLKGSSSRQEWDSLITDMMKYTQHFREGTGEAESLSVPRTKVWSEGLLKTQSMLSGHSLRTESIASDHARRMAWIYLTENLRDQYGKYYGYDTQGKVDYRQDWIEGDRRIRPAMYKDVPSMKEFPWDDYNRYDKQEWNRGALLEAWIDHIKRSLMFKKPVIYMEPSRDWHKEQRERNSLILQGINGPTSRLRENLNNFIEEGQKRVLINRQSLFQAHHGGAHPARQVMPKAGGTPVNVGEYGYPEAIVPLDKSVLAEAFAGAMQTSLASGSTDNEALLDAAKALHDIARLMGDLEVTIGNSTMEISSSSKGMGEAVRVATELNKATQSGGPGIGAKDQIKFTGDASQLQTVGQYVKGTQTRFDGNLMNLPYMQERIKGIEADVDKEFSMSWRPFSHKGPLPFWSEGFDEWSGMHGINAANAANLGAAVAASNIDTTRGPIHPDVLSRQAAMPSEMIINPRDLAQLQYEVEGTVAGSTMTITPDTARLPPKQVGSRQWQPGEYRFDPSLLFVSDLDTTDVIATDLESARWDPNRAAMVALPGGRRMDAAGQMVDEWVKQGGEWVKTGGQVAIPEARPVLSEIVIGPGQYSTLYGMSAGASRWGDVIAGTGQDVGVGTFESRVYSELMDVSRRTSDHTLGLRHSDYDAFEKEHPLAPWTNLLATAQLQYMGSPAIPGVAGVPGRAASGYGHFDVTGQTAQHGRIKATQYMTLSSGEKIDTGTLASMFGFNMADPSNQAQRIVSATAQYYGMGGYDPDLVAAGIGTGVNTRLFKPEQVDKMQEKTGDMRYITVPDWMQPYQSAVYSGTFDTTEGKLPVMGQVDVVDMIKNIKSVDSIVQGLTTFLPNQKDRTGIPDFAEWEKSLDPSDWVSMTPEAQTVMMAFGANPAYDGLREELWTPGSRLNQYSMPILQQFQERLITEEGWDPSTQLLAPVDSKVAEVLWPGKLAPGETAFLPAGQAGDVVKENLEKQRDRKFNLAVGEFRDAVKDWRDFILPGGGTQQQQAHAGQAILVAGQKLDTYIAQQQQATPGFTMTKEEKDRFIFDEADIEFARLETSYGLQQAAAQSQQQYIASRGKLGQQAIRDINRTTAYFDPWAQDMGQDEVGMMYGALGKDNRMLQTVLGAAGRLTGFGDAQTMFGVAAQFGTVRNQINQNPQLFDTMNITGDLGFYAQGGFARSMTDLAVTNYESLIGRTLANQRGDFGTFGSAGALRSDLISQYGDAIRPYAMSIDLSNVQSELDMVDQIFNEMFKSVLSAGQAAANAMKELSFDPEFDDARLQRDSGGGLQYRNTLEDMLPQTFLDSLKRMVESGEDPSILIPGKRFGYQVDHGRLVDRAKEPGVDESVWQIGGRTIRYQDLGGHGYARDLVAAEGQRTSIESQIATETDPAKMRQLRRDLNKLELTIAKLNIQKTFGDTVEVTEDITRTIEEREVDGKWYTYIDGKWDQKDPKTTSSGLPKRVLHGQMRSVYDVYSGQMIRQEEQWEGYYKGDDGDEWVADPNAGDWKTLYEGKAPSYPTDAQLTQQQAGSLGGDLSKEFPELTADLITILAQMLIDGEITKDEIKAIVVAAIGEFPFVDSVVISSLIEKALKYKQPEDVVNAIKQNALVARSQFPYIDEEIIAQLVGNSFQYKTADDFRNALIAKTKIVTDVVPKADTELQAILVNESFNYKTDADFKAALEAKVKVITDVVPKADEELQAFLVGQSFNYKTEADFKAALAAKAKVITDVVPKADEELQAFLIRESFNYKTEADFRTALEAKAKVITDVVPKADEELQAVLIRESFKYKTEADFKAALEAKVKVITDVIPFADEELQAFLVGQSFKYKTEADFRTALENRVKAITDVFPNADEELQKDLIQESFAYKTAADFKKAMEDRVALATNAFPHADEEAIGKIVAAMMKYKDAEEAKTALQAAVDAVVGRLPGLSAEQEQELVAAVIGGEVTKKDLDRIIAAVKTNDVTQMTDVNWRDLVKYVMNVPNAATMKTDLETEIGKFDQAWWEGVFKAIIAGKLNFQDLVNALIMEEAGDYAVPSNPSNKLPGSPVTPPSFPTFNPSPKLRGSSGGGVSFDTNFDTGTNFSASVVRNPDPANPTNPGVRGAIISGTPTTFTTPSGITVNASSPIGKLYGLTTSLKVGAQQWRDTLVGEENTVQAAFKTLQGIGGYKGTSEAGVTSWESGSLGESMQKTKLEVGGIRGALIGETNSIKSALKELSESDAFTKLKGAFTAEQNSLAAEVKSFVTDSLTDTSEGSTSLAAALSGLGSSEGFTNLKNAFTGEQDSLASEIQTFITDSLTGTGEGSKSLETALSSLGSSEGFTSFKKVFTSDEEGSLKAGIKSIVSDAIGLEDDQGSVKAGSMADSLKKLVDNQITDVQKAFDSMEEKDTSVKKSIMGVVKSAIGLSDTEGKVQEGSEGSMADSLAKLVKNQISDVQKAFDSMEEKDTSVKKSIMGVVKSAIGLSDTEGKVQEGSEGSMADSLAKLVKNQITDVQNAFNEMSDDPKVASVKKSVMDVVKNAVGISDTEGKVEEGSMADSLRKLVSVEIKAVQEAFGAKATQSTSSVKSVIKDIATNSIGVGGTPENSMAGNLAKLKTAEVESLRKSFDGDTPSVKSVISNIASKHIGVSGSGTAEPKSLAANVKSLEDNEVKNLKDMFEGGTVSVKLSIDAANEALGDGTSGFSKSVADLAVVVEDLKDDFVDIKEIYDKLKDKEITITVHYESSGGGGGGEEEKKEEEKKKEPPKNPPKPPKPPPQNPVEGADEDADTDTGRWTGGFALPTSGGIDVLIAEKGEGEAILPISKVPEIFARAFQRSLPAMRSLMNTAREAMTEGNLNYMLSSVPAMERGMMGITDGHMNSVVTDAGEGFMIENHVKLEIDGDQLVDMIIRGNELAKRQGRSS